MQGKGGAPRPIGQEDPSVQMVSADIHIQVPEAKVKVTYKFKNTGKATSITMGFPEEGYDAYLDAKNKTYFDYFRSWVDGKAVKVSPIFLKEDEEVKEWGYKVWWTKKVLFSAGETKTVINEYKSRAGSNTMQWRFIDYVVATASSWKGTIGSIRIEADCSKLKSGTKYIGNPAPAKVQGDTLLWYWKNAEPTAEDNDVSIIWEEKPNPDASDEAFISAFGRHPLVKN